MVCQDIVFVVLVGYVNHQCQTINVVKCVHSQVMEGIVVVMVMFVVLQIISSPLVSLNLNEKGVLRKMIIYIVII
jgi:hypothetical protein